MSQFKHPYARPSLLAYASMPPAGEPGQDQNTPPPASYGYPPVAPQSPMTPPPGMMPPHKHTRRNLGIGCGALAALVILIIVIIAVANAGNSTPNTVQEAATQAPDTGATAEAQNNSNANAGSTNAGTPAAGSCAANPSQCATQAPAKWTTTHTYTGNGIKKTEVFTVADDWKLNWTCDPSSFYGGQYNVIVDVYNADGSYADGAINTICKDGNTSGTTEEHQGGQVYLDVNSEGAWNLQVQELQ